MTPDAQSERDARLLSALVRLVNPSQPNPDGDGALKCQPLLQSPDSDFIDSYPTPESALELAMKAYSKGDFVDLASYEPMYLKAFKAGVAKDPFNLRDKTNRFAQ